MSDSNNIQYCKDFLDPNLLQKVGIDALKFDWCIPPAGIPGNHPPRNVAVLGNGSNVTQMKNGRIMKIRSKYPETVCYPLFQCAKICYGKYTMKPFTHHMNKLVLLLRKRATELYGDKLVNVNRMFNVAVCNYYTEDRHQISGHRDDERWLEKNIIGKDSETESSLIASFTYYVDEIPHTLRKFEIYDDTKKKWQNFNLEHNSIIFFSNHLHRAKAVGKKSPSCKRINITFRTLAPGLLGLTGYGNFHRYMSLPSEIGIFSSEKLERQIQQFNKCTDESNQFLGKQQFITNIPVKYFDKEERKARKKSVQQVLKNRGIELPRYIKSLCSLENYEYFNK